MLLSVFSSFTLLSCDCFKERDPFRSGTLGFSFRISHFFFYSFILSVSYLLYKMEITVVNNKMACLEFYLIPSFHLTYINMPLIYFS